MMMGSYPIHGKKLEQVFQKLRSKAQYILCIYLRFLEDIFICSDNVNR